MCAARYRERACAQQGTGSSTAALSRMQFSGTPRRCGWCGHLQHYTYCRGCLPAAAAAAVLCSVLVCCEHLISAMHPSVRGPRRAVRCTLPLQTRP
eukprot:362200-Chlamydomonas_euryale.AAC.8